MSNLKAILKAMGGFFIRFDTFVSLGEALMERFGTGGRVILFEAGKTYGKRCYDRVIVMVARIEDIFI